MLPITKNERQNQTHLFYIQLYDNYFNQYNEVASQIEYAKETSDLPNGFKTAVALNTRYNELGLLTPLFAAMFLEAYMYDFAARNLSDSYVKKHLDSLDLISKILLVPNLLFEQTISKDGAWHEPIKNLVKTRNNLMHSKSKNRDTTNAPYKKMFEVFVEPQDVRTGIEVLFDEFHRVDPSHDYPNDLIWKNKKYHRWLKTFF